LAVGGGEGLDVVEVGADEEDRGVFLGEAEDGLALVAEERPGAFWVPGGCGGVGVVVEGVIPAEAPDVPHEASRCPDHERHPLRGAGVEGLHARNGDVGFEEALADLLLGRPAVGEGEVNG
jgi:hypothetical protein